MIPLEITPRVESLPTPVNPGDPAALINGSIWPMAAISTVFLALRIYCKGFRVRWMMWLDDWLLIAGWVFLIASQSFLSEMMRLGFARTYGVTPAMSTMLYCADNCHKISLALTKTSFAVTLLRIASGWQRYIIWFLVITMNIQFIVHIILTWRAVCPRRPGDTTPHLPGSCWSAQDAITLGIFGGLYSAVSDFVLALLPWKIVLSLQMRKHEKIGVGMAMSMGILAGVMGIMKAVQSIAIMDFLGPDYFWKVCIFWVWAMAEPNATIIAASIPVLRVLFRNTLSSRPSEYPSGAYIRSDNLSKFQNRGMSAICSSRNMDRDKRDNDSDQEILGGIMKTTEVSVDSINYDGQGRRFGKKALREEHGIELANR
ncbi:hypothetical protein CABS01_09046 [Colletotrichum abscissum]|uniref:Rhodopsin domain-containing protein n=1 Tax=Colletotrichum abscissum TaxID=1671311 RepID=A0A9P9X087_9PEZI|nr:uncharacterized protein CABS01_09046 [Colletotrichum abscissum]KAI3528921.1 hypothetical protein CABS02_14967 [Colletotrichum abscissum]KAK1503657.1 hypothetical protein CABS01_09046 [Colletotrichum abscissum]